MLRKLKSYWPKWPTWPKWPSYRKLLDNGRTREMRNKNDQGSPTGGSGGSVSESREGV